MIPAIKIADAWVKIIGTTLLPGALVDDDGAHHDWIVSPEFIASHTPEWRDEKGFVYLADVEPPEGVNITGDQIVEVDGVPALEYLHEALSGDDLAALTQLQKDQIDMRAGAVITEVIPYWKQLNMLGRAADLLDIRTQRELTTDEAAEQTALRAAWAWVAAVRAHSNTLKAALPTDGPGVAAFDITAGWPSPPA